MKMRVMAILFFCAIFLMPIASAEIIINEEPSDLYNVGDVINFPIKVAAAVDTSDFLSVNLLCNGGETEIYKDIPLMIDKAIEHAKKIKKMGWRIKSINEGRKKVEINI